MKFDEFMIKLKENNFKFEDGTYFFRQKYLVQQEITQPNLQKMTCCSEIFNPDLPFLQCKENNCKIYVHKSCWNKFMMKICPKCNAKMDGVENHKSAITQGGSIESLKKNINNAGKIEEASKLLIGRKRDRSTLHVLLLYLFSMCFN